MIPYCPGAKRFKEPQPENIRCQNCGREVEIWTDEAKTVCPGCKKKVTRGEGQSCLDWCKYAKECVGEKIYNDHMKRAKKERA